ECVCICGLAMNGNDHGECPIEIRLCPEHQNKQDCPAPQTGFVEIDFSSVVKGRSALPHCECGCSEIEPGEAVGWCPHCHHLYANYSPEIENQHFAYHCPEAPEVLKESARARLAKRGRRGLQAWEQK